MLLSLYRSGLGYYRRARMLHAAAKQAVLLHGGALPSEVEGPPSACRRRSLQWRRRCGQPSGRFGRRSSQSVRRERGPGPLARLFAIEENVKAAKGHARARAASPRTSSPAATSAIPATGTRR